jgi:hypothetical protein
MPQASPEFLIARATELANLQAERLAVFIKKNNNKVENTLAAFYSEADEARCAYIILAQLLVANGQKPPINRPPIP